jgi:hemoglobin
VSTRICDKLRPCASGGDRDESAVALELFPLKYSAQRPSCVPMSSNAESKLPVASLYERLGGIGAVEAAVGLFYEKVTTDALTAPFFAQLDMAAQVRKQIAFMARAFGGPAQYMGRDLRAAHQGLVKRGLGDAHFDAIARHLQTTLQELDVPEDLIAECLNLVSGLRDEVLGR